MCFEKEVNRSIFQSCLKMLHTHVLLVAPLDADHMAQSGTDQHEGGIVIWESSHHTSVTASLLVELLNDICWCESASSTSIENHSTSVFPQ